MQPLLEITVKMVPQNKTIYIKYHLTADERRDLVNTIGDAGVLLMEYLYRLGSVGNLQISDEHIAEYFGWNIHKAKRVRLALIKHGWFAQSKYRINHKKKGITYYIGREAVAKHNIHSD